jgi:hypothetical protein
MPLYPIVANLYWRSLIEGVVVFSSAGLDAGRLDRTGAAVGLPRGTGRLWRLLYKTRGPRLNGMSGVGYAWIPV